MLTAILTKFENLKVLANNVDAGLWTGRFSPATRPTAEAVKERLIDKIERCRRVLRFRYGANV